MGLKRTDEFRADAVRIALTSGLKRKQVADDLGVGMSTLNKRIAAHRDTDVVPKEDLDLAKENDRLRRAIKLLKEEYPSGSRPRFIALQRFARRAIAAGVSETLCMRVSPCAFGGSFVEPFWV